MRFVNGNVPLPFSVEYSTLRIISMTLPFTFQRNNIFVAYVEDNATMSSIRYFENHVSYFVQKPKEVDLIEFTSLQQISVSIALKYTIKNSV